VAFFLILPQGRDLSRPCFFAPINKPFHEVAEINKMAEYILTPETKDKPPGTQLMDEIHRRGFPVEINLTGPDQDWESIRFYEAGPPVLECLLTYDPEGECYKISVSRDASPQSHELQFFLVDILLQALGGQVDNKSTQERFTPSEFAQKLKTLYNPIQKAKDLIWIGFSWAVVVAGLIALFAGSHPSHEMVGLILVVASISAVGLTYSHFKNE
jgi:hypothetical protein